MPASRFLHRAVLWTVTALATVYAVWFGVYTCVQHMRFKTYAFDLGTFDQGIWLAGHGTDWFVTVRGLPLLGDHVRLFSFVLAPMYWIVDDVRVLLVAQSIAIAAGALFLCRIALRMVPERPLLALSLAAGYLIHPAVQNLNLDHAHPDAFAMTLILAAVDFLGAGRILAFSAAAALAMSCKEDVPLVFAALGASLMLDRSTRRLGLTIAAVSSVYFLVCMAVILPSFNEEGFFRYGEKGFLAGLWYKGHDPYWLWDRLTRPETLAYLRDIGLPNLYLFLLAPVWIVPALPQLAANVLSDAHYMRNLEFHYHTSIVPFLFVATAAAVSSMDRLRTRLASRSDGPARTAVVPLLRFAAAAAPLALFAAAFHSNVSLSRVQVTHPGILFENAERMRTEDDLPKAHELIRRIPPDAVVSADFSVVPHLSHRRRIYMFPNPFSVSNWGIDGENTHDPDDVEYVLLRRVVSLEPIAEIMKALVADGYFEVLDGDEFATLYRRTGGKKLSGVAGCGDWNGDGNVTDYDATLVAEVIRQNFECPRHVCDADGNGRVEPQDALLIGNAAREKSLSMLRCPARGGAGTGVPARNAACGDWDGDGVVSQEDLRTIGETVMQGRACPHHVCDADGNGKGDARDVQAIMRAAREKSANGLRCPKAPAQVD